MTPASPDALLAADVERVAKGLTKAQRYELRQVRHEDRGYLARGDQAGLAQIGLAVPPTGQGFYCLSKLGIAVRHYLTTGDAHHE